MITLMRSLVLTFSQVWEAGAYLCTILIMGLKISFQPKTWVYPVRNRFCRQILFAGVEAIPFTCLVAAFVGTMVFVQCLTWLRFTGEIDLLSRMVGVLLFRVVAPFLTTFLVIGASASAITTELATMKTSGEVRLLEAQGINVFQYMVIPRMTGLAICVFGLSLLFVGVSILASGVGFLFFSGSAGDPLPFLRSIFESLAFGDFLTLTVMTLLPGFIMGAVCCYEGLRVRGASTEVPQAVSRAILGSISVTIAIGGLFTLFGFASKWI
ncbi:MAG: ABC transporter permease [Verrucomicrobiota bacterium]